ncbi:MAG: hypothetical protein MJY87_09730 [Fibrobacter sp.]|nr:hypothetical protein [Fibrobacter sp.]
MKIKVLLLSLVAALSLTACGSDSPEAIAKKAVDAIIKCEKEGIKAADCKEANELEKKIESMSEEDQKKAKEAAEKYLLEEAMKMLGK